MKVERIIPPLRYLQGKKNISILLIQGFTATHDSIIESMGKDLNSFGFNVYALNRSQFNPKDWVGMKNYYWNFLDQFPAGIIVIGHSLGGAFALYSAKHPNTKAVFGISTFNNDKIFKATILQKVHRFVFPMFKITEKDYVKMQSLLVSNNRFSKSQTDKMYLIHSRLDETIPFEQFETNRSMLNIPEDRCCIVEMDLHVSILYSPFVKRFIESKIEIFD
jgi:esterase/lipase